MDFELSADQVALRAAARDLLAQGASSKRVRAVLDAPTGYDPDLWHQVAAQGWLALEVPEDRGGLGLGFVEVAVLAEQLGRHVAPVPFLSTSLALGALLEAGGDSPWVDRLAGGEAIGCVRFGEGPTVDAPVADLAVAVVGDRVVSVEIGGDRPDAEPAMDRTRRIGWLDLDGRVAEPLGGQDLAAALLDRGASAYAAELLGAAERMLEASVEYAKVREQFGRPIGSFQAVKHRLADALVDVEGMRSAACYAAWAVGTGAPDRSLAASVAKSWCSDASRRVLGSALQVHGGIGFTWEHDLHLYLKRAQLDETVFGDATFHRRRVARLLRERIDAGTDLW